MVFDTKVDWVYLGTSSRSVVKVRPFRTTLCKLLLRYKSPGVIIVVEAGHGISLILCTVATSSSIPLLLTGHQ